ncbi:ferredoxin [Mycolicibacterium arenosum]|uniref:Ferredoxin n=1 Tax=Mycolicibacterium arenosum TaxID=2952157 RepID=A0ABT1M386_9MYCO|nr:ferredoxin [Mycolicibacterium sp. CAU 1645]MCP9273626.1 ferredoxin [Mycolicibacterium sp. CAU 1645]
MAGPRAVYVDPRLCEAHALCVELAPAVFDLGDDIATCDESPAASHRDDVDAAIAACPRQAIGWVDAPPTTIPKGSIA